MKVRLKVVEYIDTVQWLHDAVVECGGFVRLKSTCVSAIAQTGTVKYYIFVTAFEVRIKIDVKSLFSMNC